MKKILVIGSINYDISFSVDKLPEKGSNILSNRVDYALGGKGANLALACRNLELNVSLYARIGSDNEGRYLLSELEKKNLSTDNIEVSNKSNTGKAFICIDSSGENFIVVDKGANFSYDLDDLSKIKLLIENHDLILIQLEINLEIIFEIIDFCKKKKKSLIIDAGPIVDIDYRMFSGVFVVSPNKTELESLVKSEIKNFTDLRLACEKLIEVGVENIIVKLGASGSYYYSRDKEYFQKPYKVNSIDSTAAGDSFMAGLVLGITLNYSMEKSMDVASMCGAIATTRKGASSSLPTIKELKCFRSRYEKN